MSNLIFTNTIIELPMNQGKMREQEDRHKQLLDEETRQKTNLDRAKQKLEQEMKAIKEELKKQEENLKALGMRFSR